MIAESADMFRIEWDEAHGSVTARLSGFWSPDIGKAFYDAMVEVGAKSRARHGAARFLLDASGWQVQAVTQIRDSRSNQLFIFPGDRVALIVASQLLKLQMTTADKLTDDIGYFADRPSAEAWLHAPA